MLGQVALDRCVNKTYSAMIPRKKNKGEPTRKRRSARCCRCGGIWYQILRWWQCSFRLDRIREGAFAEEKVLVLEKVVVEEQLPNASFKR
jgi:hypothetical protein